MREQIAPAGIELLRSRFEVDEDGDSPLEEIIGRYDAIVPIGCLIRGETPHFDVLARTVATGLMELSLTYPCAIPFGVLTCDTYEQARQRAGGSEGNKGEEAMEAAFDLLALRQTAKAQTASAPKAARRASAARPARTATKRRRSPGRA